MTTLKNSQNFKTKIEDNRFIVRSDNKFGITDSLKNVIVPFIYDFIDFKNQRLIVRKNHLNGIFNIENKQFLPVDFDLILPRKNERFIVLKNKSLFGLYDINGNIIIPIKYKQVYSIENDNFYITKNVKDLNGVYDYNGHNIIPEVYKFHTVDKNKIFATKADESYVIDIYNSENNIILKENIELIKTVRHYTTDEELFQIIKMENKFGLINSKNEIIIPIIYDDLKSSQNWRYFIIKKNNKIGLINVNGTVVKEPIYDSIDLRKEYLVLKVKNKNNEIYSYEY